MTRLTKEEALNCYEAVDEIMKAFPKSKVGEFIGHFNDVLLFLGEAKQQLPSEKVETPSSLSQDKTVDTQNHSPCKGSSPSKEHTVKTGGDKIAILDTLRGSNLCVNCGSKNLNISIHRKLKSKTKEGRGE